MAKFTGKVWPKSRSVRVTIGIVAAVVSFVVIAAATWNSWLRAGASGPESTGETLRTVGLLIGGFLAFYFGIWRASVAERQSDAAQKQVEAAQLQAETAHKGFLNDRYQGGAEMLGSETLAVRLGRIYALRRLADECPEDYHIQCMGLLCAFVRNSATNKFRANARYVASPDYFPPLYDDVQAAIATIGTRSETGRNLELENNFTLDLHGADLIGANLHGVELATANLSNACLVHSDLSYARLCRVDLTKTDLWYAELSGADCSDSVIIAASLKCCNSQWMNFARSNLVGTDLCVGRPNNNWMRPDRMPQRHR